MDTRDREAIEGLFTKLGDVERQAGPRDAEAESFISAEVARQPGAPYYMAQTIVMQDMALSAQQKRIEDLERAAATPAATASAPAEGGFLSRILGGGSAAQAPRSVPSVGGARPAGVWGSGPAQAAPQYADARNPQGNPPYGQPQTPGRGFGGGMMGGGGMGGGGFLAGAAQTAMGVAGGVLLGNALAGLFTGNEAQAAEATPAAEHTAPETSEPAQTAGEDTHAQQPDEPAAQDVSADDGGWFGGDDGGSGFDEI